MKAEKHHISRDGPLFAVQSFAGLKEWISNLPCRQTNVETDPVSYLPSRQAGETVDQVTWIEVCDEGIARPDDRNFVERLVAEKMRRDIERHLNEAARPWSSLTIIWRVRFDCEIAPFPQVVEYRDDGLDFDPIEWKRCVLDRNWHIVKGYCRFAVRKS